MPPCRKICTGRLVPTLLSLPVATIGSACPATAYLAPTCPAPSCPAPACPAPACPAPAQPVMCNCHEGDSDLELECDEVTCTNAEDCKKLHPDISPLGFATDEDCPGCQEPPEQQLSPQICPHCQSQIATYDPKHQAINTNKPTTDSGKDQDCAANCPIKKPNDIPAQSSNSALESCCGGSKLKLRSPHISQIKVTEVQCGAQSPRPKSSGSAKSCCMSASAVRCAPHKGIIPANTEDVDCGGTSPKTCSMGQTRPTSQTNRTGQSGAPARPTRGASGKGKADQNPGNPNCPRSGAASTLFPAPPPPTPCLCRMPPSYNTGCTGNLSGNCNCTDCNK